MGSDTKDGVGDADFETECDAALAGIEQNCVDFAEKHGADQRFATEAEYCVGRCEI